jgi:hypothetical protein
LKENIAKLTNSDYVKPLIEKTNEILEANAQAGNEVCYLKLQNSKLVDQIEKNSFEQVKKI